MKKLFMALGTLAGLVLSLSTAHAIDWSGITKSTIGAAKAAAQAPKLESISKEEEIELGRRLHPQMVTSMGGEYRNAALKNYVRQVGNKVAANSTRTDIPYNFTVINSDMFNAFAIPGGYVYVTTGLMAHMHDESELASVLGHEVAHVTERHGLEKVKKAYNSQIMKNLAKEVGGEIIYSKAGGKWGGAMSVLLDEGLNMMVDLFSDMSQKGYGRDREREADAFGIQFSNRAQYDPYGAVRMFEYLKGLEGKEAPGGLSALLSSHPQTKERLKLAQKEIKKLEKEGATLGNKTNKQNYVAHIRGLH